MGVETLKKQKPFMLRQRQQTFLKYFLSGSVRTNDIASQLSQRCYTTTGEVTYMVESLGRKVRKYFLPEFEERMTKLRSLKILRINGIVSDAMIKMSNFPVILNPIELFPREREIVFLHSEGLSAEEIASVLIIKEPGSKYDPSIPLETLPTISPRTVGSHLVHAAARLVSINTRIGNDYQYITTENPSILTSLAYIRATNPPKIKGEDFVPPLFTMSDEYRKYYYYSYLYNQITDCESQVYQP
jgi:hypothetical protein